MSKKSKGRKNTRRNARRRSSRAQKAWDRRRFLQAMGLGAGSLFLPSLGTSALADAGGGECPKRIVFFLTQHGTIYDRWTMHRNNPTDADWEYALDTNPDNWSDVLRPLAPHADDMLVVDGLAQLSTFFDEPTNNHHAAQAHLLTGAVYDSPDGGGTEFATEPSIDQIIADAVADPSQFRSLEYGNASTFVWSGYNQKVPVESNPTSAFDRLFPQGNQMEEPSERDKIRAARGSVLDLARSEYDAMIPRLSSSDRQKLENHRDLIRDLEMRLGGLNSCAPIELGDVDRNITTQTLEQFMRLTAVALACDLTRVVTVQARQLRNEDFGAPPGDVHQDFAHNGEDPEAIEHMVNYNNVHAQHFAYLIDQLKNTPEGNGTLLDNTLAVWITELATGTHELHRIPVVMAGNLNGHFNTGRYVYYGQNITTVNRYNQHSTTMMGRGHSHLLISLAQAMGLPLSSLPMTEGWTNRHSSTDGETIDLTGPLPRLT